MRILRLIPYFSDAFGGPPHHVKMLTRELTRMGHETVIYTTNLADKSGKTTAFEGPEFDVRAFPVKLSVGDYFYTPAMREALRHEEFDLVHAHCFRNYQAELAEWIASERGKPLIFTAHGTLVRLPTARDRVLKWLYDLKNQRKVLREASKVVALSLREANQYRKLGVPHQRIVRIYHGIDGDLFRPIRDAEVLRAKRGITGGPVVLYVGRLHARKGVRYLLPAFREVLRAFPSAQMVFCGADDGSRNELERQAISLALQERVVFLGAVEHEMMPSVYALADVVTLPAQYEVFGHTIAEAAACGKPVIATKWGWAAEFFEGGKECILLDRYGDVDEIARAVIGLLADGAQRSSLGARAREKVVRELSWKTCAQKHLDMYFRALAEAKPSGRFITKEA